MGDYSHRLLQERKGQPGDDLITMLANAEIEGDRLPDEIAVSFLRQLMNAAGDTTYRSTGSLLVACSPIQTSWRRCAVVAHWCRRRWRQRCAGKVH